MRPPERWRVIPRVLTGAFLSALVVTGAGCSPEPEPIVYGEDLCAHCRMVIADERYGAELVTTRGRVFRFDSIECMADYALHSVDAAAVHSLWVTPYATPGQLISVDDAIFLHSPQLNSPMGANLTAFAAASAGRDALVEQYGGEILDWAGVLERVSAHPPGAGHMHGTPDS